LQGGVVVEVFGGLDPTFTMFLDLTIYAAGLAAVVSGALGSLDPEDVRKIFGDPSTLQTGRLQLFALQYYLYLGLLQGLLVYPICLLTVLLSAPMVAVAVLKAMSPTTTRLDYS